MNPIATVVAELALLSWLLIPLSLLLLAAYASWTSNPRKLAHCWTVAKSLFVALMAITGFIGLMLLADSPGFTTGLPEIGAQFGLFPSGLSLWMSMLVGFIGWVIIRYADDYLRGDPGRARFFPWFLITLASVLVLVLTNHLLILVGAWVGVSLSFHHLLTLYPERGAANAAALQKFIISRVGDVCVFSAVLLLHHQYGTFYLPEMMASAGGGADQSLALQSASVLLAIAALMKCAQLPVHGWLLRVMEAPTPVSALLHAGIINLGGFLWLRLYPVLDGFTPGHGILLVVGGVTAVVAALVMMTQSSVKHSLAWSTSAQMGFMLFEIGLGAYTLAFLHLVAHSLYKAHSFLASSRTVLASHSLAGYAGVERVQVINGVLAAVVAAVILSAVPALVEGKLVLGTLLVLACTAAALGIPAWVKAPVRASLLLCTLMLLPLYSLLHALLSPALGSAHNLVLPFSAQVAGLAIVAALAAGSLMILLKPLSRISRALHHYCCEGLGLDLPLNRLSAALARKTRGFSLSSAKPTNLHKVNPLSSGERS
ncbi:MAG: NADH-quinone oxidoreductase subunit L [Marinobacter sp.]